MQSKEHPISNGNLYKTLDKIITYYAVLCSVHKEQMMSLHHQLKTHHCHIYQIFCLVDSVFIYGKKDNININININEKEKIRENKKICNKE